MIRTSILKPLLQIIAGFLISISAAAQSDIGIEYLEDEEGLVSAIIITDRHVEQLSVSNTASRDDAILGELTEVNDDCLKFTPAVPFDAGQDYFLHFFCHRINAFRHQLFRIGEDPAIPFPKVINIYPSSTYLPENLLRLYVEFDQPMREDNFLAYVSLLNEQGKELKDAFLPSRYEYWNRERTKITLIFDPGRVKTGLIAHESLGGRILKSGGRYTLTITNDWLSMQGKPLQSKFTKTFEVVSEDMRKINPQNWEVSAPRARSRAPLKIHFGRNIDHINAMTHLVVVDASGDRVAGTLVLSNNEQTLCFAPHKPWLNSRYRILIDPKLEDVCGNNLIHGFDVFEASKISANYVEKYQVLEFTPK